MKKRIQEFRTKFGNWWWKLTSERIPQDQNSPSWAKVILNNFYVELWRKHYSSWNGSPCKGYRLKPGEMSTGFFSFKVGYVKFNILIDFFFLFSKKKSGSEQKKKFKRNETKNKMKTFLEEKSERNNK